MRNMGIIIGRYIAAIDDGIVVRISSPKSQDIPVILRGKLKERVQKYMKEDGIVAIRYQLEMDDNFSIQVVADRVTFMSSETAGETLEGGDEDGNI